jgi:hypothetical protein
LKTLKGAPKRVGYNFYCYDCGKEFTEGEARMASKIKGKIYC